MSFQMKGPPDVSKKDEGSSRGDTSRWHFKTQGTERGFCSLQRVKMLRKPNNTAHSIPSRPNRRPPKFWGEMIFQPNFYAWENHKLGVNVEKDIFRYAMQKRTFHALFVRYQNMCPNTTRE